MLSVIRTKTNNIHHTTQYKKPILKNNSNPENEKKHSHKLISNPENEKKHSHKLISTIENQNL